MLKSWNYNHKLSCKALEVKKRKEYCKNQDKQNYKC